MNDKPSNFTLPEYSVYAAELKSASLAVTPGEAHGLVLGMIAGGLIQGDASWKPLLFDYTNDGLAWPVAAIKPTEQLVQFCYQQLLSGELALEFLLPDREGEDGLFERADAVAELINHFISGLGLIALDTRLLTEQGKEAMADLEEMAKLGIDENDDLQEQAILLEQVIEHTKACVLILHADHGSKPSEDDVNPTVH